MKTRDLTQGSVLKNITVFSLPYLLSYFLQTLYGLADMYIVGQFNRAATITAVSTGSQMLHMQTVIIVGLAMGVTIRIGQGVGAKDRAIVRKAIGNGIVIFVIFAVVLTGVLSCLVGPVVSVMLTPTESVDETAQYLRICFLGIPFIVAYNVISSIFRGMGDSKSPLLFVAVACVVNIVLDYVFIGVLGMGARGAALGTVTAQAVSVVVSLIFILRRRMIEITRKDFRLDAGVVAKILRTGGPIAVQDGLIQVAFLTITAIANNRGVQMAAAVGIVEKIISIVFLIPSTMSSAVSAICAQNNGAGEHKRAQKTMGYGILICVIFGTACVLLCQLTKTGLIGLFDDEEEVIRYGAQYLSTYIFDCVLAGMHFCFSGFFAAYNLSWISFVHNVASIALCRIPGAYLASLWYPDRLEPMGLAAPAGSLLSVLICIVAYRILCKVKINSVKGVNKRDELPDI